MKVRRLKSEIAQRTLSGLPAERVGGLSAEQAILICINASSFNSPL
jgi:hypothetical protein